MNIKDYTRQELIENFDNMIKNSWTYDMMTKEEKEIWNFTFKEQFLEKAENIITFKKLSNNTYWHIMYVAYESYLAGLGYSNINGAVDWRRNENEPKF